jgi:hypothetical protein
MGRYNKMHSVLVKSLTKRMQRQDTSGPTFIACADRLAVLCKLYEVKLDRPVYRPNKPGEPEAPEIEPEDSKGDELYKGFLEENFGGENGTQSNQSPSSKDNEGTG